MSRWKRRTAVAPIEPGTLYRVLAYLEQRGWIEGLHAEGPLRQYRLTALGMLALVIWLAMWDMPMDPTVLCSDHPGDMTCPISVYIGMHTPQLSIVLLSTLPFVPTVFLPLLVFLVGVVAQTIQRKRWWNLLRLLPITSFILVGSNSWYLAGWLNGLVQGVFVISIALLAESGGAMLISARKWEKRHHLLAALIVRLLALVVTVGGKYHPTSTSGLTRN